MSKVKPIPEFTLNNIPRKYYAFGEAIFVVARVVNKLVDAHNDLVDEVDKLKWVNHIMS